MKRPAIVVASVVAIFGTIFSVAAVSPHTKSETGLTGKFVIVYSTTDCLGVVQNVTVEKLGNRAFVVFPWDEPDGVKHDYWLPLESVRALRSFDKREDALAAYEREFPDSRRKVSQVNSAGLPGTATVTGIVTLRGKPLVDATLRFHAVDDVAFAMPLRNQDGKYALERIPPGEYSVTVEGERVPSKFRSPRDSQLRVQIKPGTNALDFALE